MDTFGGSGDVFAWLSRFVNFEKNAPPEGFRLDRMEALADLAGRPERSAPALHIAGSKGKGSVTGMIGAILEEGGMNPARYTSPHVSDYRERIARGKTFFDEALYTAAGGELRDLYETFKAPALGEPTFFEMLTLYFFLCARRGRCGVMAVETGMGGRLDATNILDPLVSIITSIELEHTRYLGTTVAAVAGEKGGIIKPGRPLILAEQKEEALGVLREIAAEKKAPLVYFPEAAEIGDLRLSEGGTAFTLAFKGARFFPRPLRVTIPVPGEIQAKNAALAALAVKTAFPDTDAKTICRGLSRVTLPARFERILPEPPLVIDGAHTPESVKYCADTFAALYGEGGILLFGCAEDKDAPAMAAVLAPRFSRIVITAPGNFKASCPEKVCAAFKDARGKGETPPALIAETGAAVEAAVNLSKETGLPLLGTGSFYLAAELRKLKP
jgi:dihydrofolate synthase/folylpolyglutamate synthase